MYVLIRNNFKMSGGNTGRPKAVRSLESTEQVNSIIKEIHQKSVRRLLGNITKLASVYSNILHDAEV